MLHSPFNFIHIMAKLKKTEETVEQNVLAEGAGNVVEPTENAGVEVVKDEASEDTGIEVTKDELPENVKKILKMYCNYEKLAVDAQGGVYVEGTQPLSNNKAILYQNPYYKQ